MNICFDNDVDATNTIKIDLFVFVVSPIAHSCHVLSASIVLFVALGKDNIFIQARSQSATFIGLDPGIVIEAAFNVNVITVSMKPNVYSALAY